MKLNKKCSKCRTDEWSCVDNTDCYYEICSKCYNTNTYRKQQLVDDCECPDCGGLSGHAEENKRKFGIRCDNCGKLFIQFEKAEGAIDNRNATDRYPKCPHCGSIYIHKISATKRVLGAATLGLASSSIGKTMECSKCGYKW